MGKAARMIKYAALAAYTGTSRRFRLSTMSTTRAK